MAARVDVIVRTKERPDFLERALADIAAQSMTSWRAVVVNDGGRPHEVEQVVADSSVSDKVHVVHIAPGEGGRCIAANTGVREADAPLVVLHDDDDLWHPEFLARTTSWLDAHPDSGAVSVPTEIVYEERRGSRWVEADRAPFWAGMSRISLAEMLVINRIVPISIVYRRSLHDEVGGYDESLDAVEDWEFYLRVLPRHPIGFIPGTTLAYWTQRPGVTGAAANSMFELSADHARDDAIVRDRALATWIATYGPGLPLYLAGIEKRVLERIAGVSPGNRGRSIVDVSVWRAVRRRLRRVLRGLRSRSTA